ncbi:unnamed protein product, partial [Notodromas monacha]
MKFSDPLFQRQSTIPSTGKAPTSAHEEARLCLKHREGSGLGNHFVFAGDSTLRGKVVKFAEILGLEIIDGDLNDQHGNRTWSGAHGTETDDCAKYISKLEETSAFLNNSDIDNVVFMLQEPVDPKWERLNSIADFWEILIKTKQVVKKVTPDVEPGYLRNLIPYDPPDNPEPWKNIIADVESKIMIGMTHWQHPQFHAYFPAGNSYPSILGDMLGDALGCVGFSWAASPACTELETIVLDWLGRMIGLPKEFLAFSEGSRGGGVIQTSASECILVNLLAARAQAIKKLKQQHPFVEEGVLLSKLMAYCSKEAHSCVEKAAMISFVKLRILEPDDQFSLRGNLLRQAVAEDVAIGLIPFFCSTTLGTTSCCSFDNLHEIGPVCQEFGIWLHVDAAYGGNAFICPEFRHLMNGIEYASSFNTNPNKWMLVNFDTSTMWVKDRFQLTQALVVDPLYLQHNYSDTSIDYRHWGIPLSRRFRSLKLWFVIRTYGVTGLRAYIRNHCRLAKRFEKHVEADARFEVVNNVRLGLVCFRLRGTNHLNQQLLSLINASGRLHMVPALLNDKFVIRFCVTAEHAVEDHIGKVKDRFQLTQALVVDPLYLQHNYSDTSIDYRHWGIPLSRRFRSLKLWFVIRTYGVTGLRAYIRNHCRLAKRFEKHVEADARFEVVNNVRPTAKEEPSEEPEQVVPRVEAVSPGLYLEDMKQDGVEKSAAVEEPDENASPAVDTDTDTDARQQQQQQQQQQLLHKQPPGRPSRRPSPRDAAAMSAQDMLKYKRSFFVRMVSDPKIYNPKIIRSLSTYTAEHHHTNPGAAAAGAAMAATAAADCLPEDEDEDDEQQLPLPNLWPLASILSGSGPESGPYPASSGPAPKVPVQFRNWNTQLTLRSPRVQSRSSSRSPKRSATIGGSGANNAGMAGGATSVDESQQTDKSPSN